MISALFGATYKPAPRPTSPRDRTSATGFGDANNVDDVEDEEAEETTPCRNLDDGLSVKFISGVAKTQQHQPVVMIITITTTIIIIIIIRTSYFLSRGQALLPFFNATTRKVLPL